MIKSAFGSINCYLYIHMSYTKFAKLNVVTGGFGDITKAF